MNWTTGRDAGSIVTIPDEHAEAVLALIDTHGEFPIDLYQDAEVEVEVAHVVLLRQRLREAIESRRAEHRAEVLRRLHLRQWEPWAQGMLDAAEGGDGLLHVLVELERLCEEAERRRASVLMLGD